MSDTDPDSDHPDSKIDDSKTKFLWIGFPVIFIIWLGYYGVQSPLEKDSSFDRLNALFSGFAFWGVIYAILLQKSELILQRRELELTRNEVRGQKKQLEAQNLTMKRQRFENTFFSLLDLLSNMVNSIELTVHGIDSKGRACFTVFCNEFDHSYQTIKHQNQSAALKQLCREAFVDLHGRRQSYLDHYFLTLYHIIRYVDLGEVDDKSIYINFLKAQLSSSELKLLLYKCLSEIGSSKFEPLLQKHGLFENLRQETLMDHGHLSLLKDA
jgi:hypothetical protein